jgi:hypothetical protein
MSDSTGKCCSNPKMLLGTLALFVGFGFLALILFGFVGNESVEDRAYKGEFTPEVTNQRWANLEEVKASQSELVDEAKLTAALASLAKAPAKPEPSGIVVPGSPTFLKQAEQAAAPATPAPATPAPATPAPATPAPATPAPATPAPATPAPATPAPATPAPATPAPAK